MRRRAIPQFVFSMGAALWLAACSPKAAPSVAQPTQQYRLTATVQELMDGLIDPSADTLWDSVAFIATTTGTEERRPRTDDDWKAVRSSALNLIEAANLLSMPGRRVATDSPTTPPPGLGELSHAEIQQRIDANHDAFVQFARALQDSTLKALGAIDAQDPQALMDAGGTIDEACEACHITYWYPNQQRR